MRRLQDCEPTSDREARSHHKHVLGESGVLRISDLVQNMPGDNHRHDHRLARPRGHLGAQAAESPAIARDVYAHLLTGGRFRQPDERLGRLELTKEKTAILELLRVCPVFQQPLGDRGHAGITGVAPLLHARSNLVDQRDFDKHAWVVESLGVRRRYQVARRPATRLT